MSTKMWKVAYGQACPAEVTAETPKYPNYDSDGDQIYENTHFTDEEAAWEKHEREHVAGLQLSTSRVKQAREELARCEKQVADAALFVAAVWDARRDRAEALARKGRKGVSR